MLTDWNDRPWGRGGGVRAHLRHDAMMERAAYGDGNWWLWALLLVVLLAALVYVAVRLATRPRPAGAAAVQAAAPAAATSARQTLEDRLARGEIEPDEFRDRLTALGEE